MADISDIKQRFDNFINYPKLHAAEFFDHAPRDILALIAEVERLHEIADWNVTLQAWIDLMLDPGDAARAQAVKALAARAIDRGLTISELAAVDGAQAWARAHTPPPGWTKRAEIMARLGITPEQRPEL